MIIAKQCLATNILYWGGNAISHFQEKRRNFANVRFCLCFCYVFKCLLKSQWWFLFSALQLKCLAHSRHLKLYFESWMLSNKSGFIMVQEILPKSGSSGLAGCSQDAHPSSLRDWRQRDDASLYSLLHLQNMEIICSQVKCLWRMWFIALPMTYTEFEFGDRHLSMKRGRFMDLSTL